MAANCGDALNRHRVLRGGSWNNNERNARCDYRNRNDPNNINNNIGFRVVVRTFFPFQFWLECQKCSPGEHLFFLAAAVEDGNHPRKNGGVHSWPRRVFHRPGE